MAISISIVRTFVVSIVLTSLSVRTFAIQQKLEILQSNLDKLHNNVRGLHVNLCQLQKDLGATKKEKTVYNRGYGIEDQEPFLSNTYSFIGLQSKADKVSHFFHDKNKSRKFVVVCSQHMTMASGMYEYPIFVIDFTHNKQIKILYDNDVLPEVIDVIRKNLFNETDTINYETFIQNMLDARDLGNPVAQARSMINFLKKKTGDITDEALLQRKINKDGEPNLWLSFRYEDTSPELGDNKKEFIISVKIKKKYQTFTPVQMNGYDQADLQTFSEYVRTLYNNEPIQQVSDGLLKKLFPQIEPQVARDFIDNLAKNTDVPGYDAYSSANTYSYKDYENLSACACVYFQLPARVFITLHQVNSILKRYQKKNDQLRHLSLGAGNLLQTFWLVKLLTVVGYTNIVINAIDPDTLQGNIDAFNLSLIKEGITASITLNHYRLLSDYLLKEGKVDFKVHSIDMIDVAQNYTVVKEFYGDLLTEPNLKNSAVELNNYVTLIISIYGKDIVQQKVNGVLMSVPKNVLIPDNQGSTTKHLQAINAWIKNNEFRFQSADKFLNLALEVVKPTNPIQAYKQDIATFLKTKEWFNTRSVEEQNKTVMTVRAERSADYDFAKIVSVASMPAPIIYRGRDNLVEVLKPSDVKFPD